MIPEHAPVDVEKLRELLSKATPGPWLAFDNRDLNEAFWIGTEKWSTHAETRRGSDDVADHVAEDAALIVAAVNALPALLTAYEQASAMRDGLEPIFARLDRGNDAPGHSHQRPGIWDDDNAAGIAGTRCEWCAQWSAARAALKGQPS